MHDAANGMNEAAEAHRDEYEGMRNNTDGQAAEPSPAEQLISLFDFVARREADHQFTYHAPSAGQLVRYDAIRQMGRVMAHTIIANAPHSPDRSTALRKLREAVMTANAAIALENGPADNQAHAV